MYRIENSAELARCHQLQTSIFHRELNLFGMQIPDRYDCCSVYMQIVDTEAVVGTYRIVLPNSAVGLPIEEAGFEIDRFDRDRVCEMSRLVIAKKKRGKIPFGNIISSACQVGKQHGATLLVVAILPRNLPLFQRYGFTRVGDPLYDATVKSNNGKESIVVPMTKPV